MIPDVHENHCRTSRPGLEPRQARQPQAQTGRGPLVLGEEMEGKQKAGQHENLLIRDYRDRQHQRVCRKQKSSPKGSVHTGKILG